MDVQHIDTAPSPGCLDLRCPAVACKEIPGDMDRSNLQKTGVEKDTEIIVSIYNTYVYKYIYIYIP